MKKVLYIIIPTILIAYAIALVNQNVLAYGELQSTDEGASGTEALSAYAYELQLIRYEKDGDIPEAVGKRALIYNPDIMKDILNIPINSAGNIPHSFDDFYNNTYPDLSYMSYPEEELWEAYPDETWDLDDPAEFPLEEIVPVFGASTGDPNDDLTDLEWMFANIEPGVPANVDSVLGNYTYTDENGVEKSVVEYTYGLTLKTQVCYGPTVTRNPASGSTGYTVKTYQYNTKAMKAMYYGSDIKVKMNGQIQSISERYHKVVEDSSLTEDNIVNNDYLGKILDGLKTPSAIKEYFDFEIPAMDIHKYYVQATPVHRVIEKDRNNLTRMGTYVVGYHKKEEPKETFWTISDWYESGTTCATEGYEIVSINGVDTCFKEWCEDCPSGKTCNVSNSCSYSSTGTATTACKASCGDNETQASSGCWYFTPASSWFSLPTLHTDGVTCNYSTTVTNYATYKSATAEPIPLYSLGCFDPGKRIEHIMYGTLVKGPSYLVLSTESGQYLERAVNTCANNYHCKYADNGVTCTSDNEYYIGPNKDNGLVANRETAPYKLYGDGINGEKCGDPVASAREGVRHVYITPEYTCKTDVCSQVCNPSASNYDECMRTDEYLKCAENYCDAVVDKDLHVDDKGEPRENAREKKKTCILQCGYSYGESPSLANMSDKERIESADRESINSCGNSKRRKDGVVNYYLTLQNTIDMTSTCNISNQNGLPMQENPGTNVSECYGEKITDFDNIYNDTTFDHRTYVNKVCAETTAFEFKDTTKEEITPGTGFTYPVKQTGSKKCTYFFNLEQWKFDYATVPSRDLNRRVALKQIVEDFNNEIVGTTIASVQGKREKITANGLDDDLFEDARGTLSFQTEGYEFGKAAVDAEVEEEETGLQANGIEKRALDMRENKILSSTTSTKLTVQEKHDQLIMVANRQIEKERPDLKVNRFDSVGGGEQTYSVKKVCISTDGMATVYDAPEDEKCQMTKDENGNDVIVYGESKHYTSFKLDPDKENDISTNASVGVNTKTDTNKYYKNNETCTYSSKGTHHECKITIDISSEGTKKGNKEYEGKEVTVSISYEDQGDVVRGMLKDNGEEQEGETITVKNKYNRTVQDHYIEGYLIRTDGTKEFCGDDSFKLYDNGKCGVSCEIKALEGDGSGTLYEIKGTNATKYYSYTSTNAKATLGEVIASGSNPYSYMLEVGLSVSKGKRIIRLSEPLKEGEILYGYVTTGDTSCNAYCPITNDENHNDKPDCTKLYEPADTAGIKEYCAPHWDEDVNGYEDEDDCFKKCSIACPNKCSDKETVETFCESNYSKLGYTEAKLCINGCYCPPTPPPPDIDGQKDKYVFRQVNVANPFPYSDESELPYEKGKREIGRNWVGLSEYITHDDNDASSVTGNQANTNVEYVIDLTPENIRSIRTNTSENIANTESNKRKVYTKLERVKSGSKYVEEYRSKFLRNEYASLLQDGHGSIPATFNANG